MGARPLATPPSLALRAMEARWPLEVATFPLVTLAPVRLPPGDGHPVLVLPGFMAGDTSTIALRGLIGRHGYAVDGWDLGTNVGPTRSILQGLRRRLDEVSVAGTRRVSLVGWSLGGIYARGLAREHPELVRRVVTLGSPFRMVEGDQSSVSLLRPWARPGEAGTAIGRIAEQDRPPLQVPATSIYTRTDGVVRWQLCLDQSGPGASNARAENIEVYGSHCGLGFNVAAAVATLDRLAQPDGAWAPFRPPAGMRRLFPPPANWSADLARSET